MLVVAKRCAVKGKGVENGGVPRDATNGGMTPPLPTSRGLAMLAR
ncbi:hypothetical protein [Rhizorhabdus phycosphaerae]|nr:hypothetical protein [Rhizorhabdus phycosphaerae]